MVSLFKPGNVLRCTTRSLFNRRYKYIVPTMGNHRQLFLVLDVDHPDKEVLTTDRGLLLCGGDGFKDAVDRGFVEILT